MKHLVTWLTTATLLAAIICHTTPAMAAAQQEPTAEQDSSAILDSTALDDDVMAAETFLSNDTTMAYSEPAGVHKVLKKKFIEGNAGFMSLVALALVLGLAFCIERIIYLSLSEINAKKFMADLDDRIMAGDIEGAKSLCRDTRGPVASICYQGLVRISESTDNIERSIASYGSVQSANLEKGCSWITLFITVAAFSVPS